MAGIDIDHDCEKNVRAQVVVVIISGIICPTPSANNSTTQHAVKLKIRNKNGQT